MSTNDDSDNEQKSNKRQKLNNDNNSNTDVDITSLEKKTIPQLKEIASSLGAVIKSGSKKNEIIERITSIYKRKQDTLKKKVVYDNINSFNKGVVEFTIIGGVDPLEWLFWKVFRNKFIYKSIMSNMDKQFSIPYDSIIFVPTMIESNKISILRDKVARNQYLTFNKLDGYKDNYPYNGENFSYDWGNEIFKIFSTFKSDNDQNRLFFKYFYKNYSKFITRCGVEIVGIGSNPLDAEKGRERLVNEMIGARCLPALQVLIQDYQYKPTHLNLQLAIIGGSVKFIQFILQHQPQLIESVENILNELVNFKSPLVNTINYMKVSKSLYYLFNEKVIDNTTVTSNTVYQDIQSNKIQINEITPLKKLIKIGKLLLLLSTGSNEIINNNEIESLSNGLSKQELKLPLTDPSFQIQHKKDTIKKMLDLYYLACKFESKSEFYHLYFSGNGSDYSGQCNDWNYQFETSLQFANFTLLKHCLEKNKIFTLFDRLDDLIRCLEMKNDGSSIYKNKDFIFSHSTGENNKERRLNFINSILMAGKNEQAIRGSFQSSYLFILLVGSDNIELVKHLSSTFNKGFVTVAHKAIPFIKSIGMLEYLFENHNYIFEAKEIWKLSNLQLFKHYELLHHQSTDNNKIIEISIKDQTTSFYPSTIMSNEILCYILEKGPSTFKFCSTSMKNIIQIIVNYYSTDDHCKFELLKLLFTKYQNCVGNGDDCGSRIKYFEYFSERSFLIHKFINWLFINHKDYLASGKIESQLDKYQDGIPIEAYFLTGRFNQLTVTSSFESLINRFCGSGLLDNCLRSNGLLDLICNNLNNSTSPFFIVEGMFTYLLNSISANGKLELLKHIQLNHSWIFKPHSKKSKTQTANDVSPSLFTNKELKMFLLQSLRSTNLEVSEFLFEFISLTKNEYTCHSKSAVSELYFKDKFK